MLIGVPKGEATALVESNNAGIVFEPENSIALCAAIDMLLSNEAERNQIKENCLAAAKRYDRKQLALNMLKELEGVVSCAWFSSDEI